MSGNILNNLANTLNNHFSVGENQTHNLSGIVDGQKNSFGALGDYAKRVDQSEERQYMEEGYLRTDPFGVKTKQFEILMQQPSATLLVKKRQFCSVADNYDFKYMDNDEKLFFKSMNVLFQNKCNQISRLEALSKIQKITDTFGSLSDNLMPIIVSLTEGLDSGNGSDDIVSFKDTVDRLKKIYYMNQPSFLTKWITDDVSYLSTKFGRGTGVMELTNFTSFTTTNTLHLKQVGAGNFNFSDPYNAMTITEYDIEKAISDATNVNNNSSFFNFGQEESKNLVSNLTNQLNQMRKVRGAGDITFNISPETIVGRRVIAIIDSAGVEIKFTYDAGFGGINNLLNAGSGSNVSVDPAYLMNGDIAGINGLSTTSQKTDPLNKSNSFKPITRKESELSIFTQIVVGIFNLIQLEANANSSAFVSNVKTNYARKKLRFSFLGKCIIQPMDSIHLYINSKSRYDNRLVTGVNKMFTGSGMIQNLNKTVTDLKSSLGSITSSFGGSSIDVSMEKQTYVGDTFPTWLWNLVRNSFVNEKEGTHVYAGVVERATSSWADGGFSVSVQASDNGSYLDKGKVNIKPGIDTFNGVLFDPLTPFKTKFDSVNTNGKGDVLELLDENVRLLSSSQDLDSAFVKFKLGPNAGKLATKDNINQEQSVNKNTQLSTRTFFAPDGLVYKWKEGLGGTIGSGSSLDINENNTTGNTTIAKEPFAGQDVMNVVSLLITGVPYNFATYWQAVSDFDGFTKESLSNDNSASSYFTALRQDLSKNNLLWGNFIPFKSLSVDEQSYKKTLQGILNAKTINTEVESKINQIAELRQASFLQGAAFEVLSTGSESSESSKTSEQLNQLSNNVIKLLKESRDKLKEDNATDFVNADATETFSESLDPNNDKNSGLTRKALRRKINNLTRRMSYNVRANEDKNLFIVDDSYDKDYDLMAFSKNLGTIDRFKNDFTSVKDNISTVADIIQLEVFCDSQGNIRIRSPQYNRMPSSVFYRMMELKKTKGIQVFPDFLNTVFSDQITTLSERASIIEDEIRLLCAVAGINTDAACHNFINNNSTIKDSGKFHFVSNASGEITAFDTLTKQNDPESSQNNVGFFKPSFSGNAAEDTQSAALAILNNQSSSNKVQFSNSQRVSSLLEAVEKAQLSSYGYKIDDNFSSNFENNSYIDLLIERIRHKSGRAPNKFEYYIKITNTSSVDLQSAKELDVFKLLKDLSNKVKERQTILKLLNSSVKSIIEFKSLDENPSTKNNLLMPSIYGNSQIPEVFEHMIEDETFDDYGEGSGSRYIIKDSQIISLTVEENPPDFNYVQVRGVLNQYDSNNLPSGLNQFPDGGNALVTADALDYDMWRMYGFRNQAPINIPFFNDPVNQCLPYASMLLGRARKNILKASLTISGNEFMQQGEVIFIESKGLLFYVSEVKHDYSEGSSFRTSLTLTYGHPPGEYIPVPLDVIGKLLFRNSSFDDYRVQRQSNAFNEVPMGVILRDKQSETNNNISLQGDNKSKYSDQNITTLNNLLYNAAKIINSNDAKGSNVKITIQLRYYFNNNSGEFSEMKTFVQSIKDSLVGKTDLPTSTKKTLTDKSNRVSLSDKYVEIIPVNLSDSSDYKSPSQKAHAASRNLATSYGISTTGNETQRESLIRNNKEQFALFENVVDCFVKFDQVIEG